MISWLPKWIIKRSVFASNEYTISLYYQLCQLNKLNMTAGLQWLYTAAWYNKELIRSYQSMFRIRKNISMLLLAATVITDLIVRKSHLIDLFWRIRTMEKRNVNEPEIALSDFTGTQFLISVDDDEWFTKKE